MVSLALAFAAALVALYVLEGLVVGKLVQPGVLYVGFVAVAAPPWPLAVGLAGVCAVAATAGHWLLYRAFTPNRPPPGGDRRPFRLLSELPHALRRWLGRPWVSLVERQFDRFGGVAIPLCTALPAVRTVVPVVAGLGRYPERRFVPATALGNAFHLGLLLAAAYGILGARRLFVGI